MSAKASFQEIDYRVRPNKSTERKMLCEVFSRLSFFEPVENYKYVGFGSTTFTDFILMHRNLNIKEMVSIERKTKYKKRFEFNKPFDCVQVKYGESMDVLPKLHWDKRSIVWLDYDGIMNGSVLQDIAFVSSNICSGGMLIITINAGGYKTKIGEDECKILERFKEDIDRSLPIDLRPKNLQGDEMSITCRRFITNEIKESLRGRNGLNISNKMNFQQLFNIVYRDGAKMLTVGGVFYNNNEKKLYDRCQFDKFKYVSLDDKIFEINVPVMTPKERHFLDQKLPAGAANEALNIGLTEKEIQNYIQVYRYCPSYAQIELM